MKRILGLDPGTNSIGWGLIDSENHTIVASGSRIIPTTQDVINAFDRGDNIQSATSERTEKRLARRRNERRKQRRERLNRILSVIDFLPKHYSDQLDRYGKIIPGHEPKIAWIECENGKREFLFKKSFEEMLMDFAKHQPELLLEGRNVPYDWTVYYLRNKALHSKIEKGELAWVLHQFNQKRGYFQLRNEEDAPTEGKEYLALTISRVEKTDEKKGKNYWYNIYFEGHSEEGFVYRRTSSFDIDWVGKTKNFVVTSKPTKDGTIKYSFKLADDTDWGLQKVKAELSITNSGQTIGSYIYHALLERPSDKIIGQLVRVVDRKFYRNELYAILKKQQEFHPELSDRKLYEDAIRALYPSNDSYRQSIANNDMLYLLAEETLLYQRPLKSKKGLIDNCPNEKFEYTDNKTGNKKVGAVKCCAKSNPYFQEYRLWQFVNNLRIYKKNVTENGKLLTDVDVTSLFLPTHDSLAELFDKLNNLASIKQDALLKEVIEKKGNKYKEYRWNYVEDKEYPCNRTRHLIYSAFKKANVSIGLLPFEEEYHLWHLLYSISSKEEFTKALKKYAKSKGYPVDFVEVFSKLNSFVDEGYASFSEKSIKRLLPFMRCGKHWDESQIDASTASRINKIINGEADQSISQKTRETFADYDSIEQFQGLPQWKASYAVYDHHSEAQEVCKWESPSDIDKYLSTLKINYLRNPIVEKLIRETLCTVRDVWKKYGKIDEIHIELGRNLKNSKQERQRISAQIAKNESDNLRVRYLLEELKGEIPQIRPYSHSQQEILHLYESDVWETAEAEGNDAELDDMRGIRNNIGNSDPSKRATTSEILRYKAWLDQRYISPYTGNPIPLSKLFSEEYEIEHVIPKSRYFDDSFNNKVICETEVNKLKDNSLGLEFIDKEAGRIVQLNGGGSVKILSVEEYQALVLRNFSHNRKKMSNLLLDDIPEQMISRKMNDTRYISKYILGLLSNIVREKDEEGNIETESKSKHVVVCNGQVTTTLKRDWGANSVWNRLMLPRFQRMNKIDKPHAYTTFTKSGHEIPSMPTELLKNFDIKRIDHRHHAMDAIVIACCTAEHVNLLSNEAAKEPNRRYDLSHKLRNYEPRIINGEKRDVPVSFKLPWESFPQDLQNSLEGIIVSFKQNAKVIKKVNNYYFHIDPITHKKERIKQENGNLLSVCHPIHKETIHGEVNLKLKKTVSFKNAINDYSNIVDTDIRRKVSQLVKKGVSNKDIIAYFQKHSDVWPEIVKSKIEVYYFTKDTNERYFATRFLNDLVSIFNGVTDINSALKVIESITDTGIQKILLAHLDAEGRDAAKAFSPEGIDRMNANIQILNGGKKHKPIKKVRIFEKGNRFPLGQKGCNPQKYSEAASGANMFMLVYATAEEPQKRKFITIPLYIVADCQKQYRQYWKDNLIPYLKQENPQFGMPLIPNSAFSLFIISPNDLVYVPEQNDSNTILKDRIYKCVSISGTTCDFVPHRMASVIHDVYEYTRHHKQQKSLTGEMIKEVCIPISVNRIGDIVDVWEQP